ncbi:NADase-type glycan-binding domain-containing protein [Breznakiella homolactica]|uniref:NAD glycohydrolase translocation F5/8 type C domain-containing protein n=1 Tax=Breznakiella homolactica TaxID=2798577 RepID=A0A7T7XQ14_9SPIR|nr:hypothetical protein [Breznakiella homolactica]QQO10390.1 hypothetical protein JFL75_05580 [Breznakiella homolactica]
MKRRWFFIILCIFKTSFLFCLNYSASDLSRSITLTDTKIIFEESEKIFSPEYKILTNKEEYMITWEFSNGIAYINFNYTGKMFNGEENGEKKYLVLYDEPANHLYISFYNKDNELIYELFGWKYTIDGKNKVTAQASSELQEKNILYSAENILNLNKLIPWVEGIDGAGIGEKIKITRKENNYFFGMLLSNGFVDYNRPNLYVNNNRVKKIRIYYGETGNFTDFEINDSPHYQYIQFPYSYNEYWNSGIIIDYIEVEILDVYKGDRWDDTCINSIYILAD